MGDQQTAEIGILRKGNGQYAEGSAGGPGRHAKDRRLAALLRPKVVKDLERQDRVLNAIVKDVESAETSPKDKALLSAELRALCDFRVRYAVGASSATPLPELVPSEEQQQAEQSAEELEAAAGVGGAP